MHLLVGLGNVGREYELTRHNFGFLTIDQIAEDYALKCLGKKFKGEVFSGEIDNKKVVALKPHTFMNLSGRSVIEAANFYKIPLANIVVFHDEIDLEIGRVKTKIGGGSAGHNGLKSIDEIVGKNYARVRLGVGRPLNPNIAVADYVLGKFSAEELQKVESVNQKISKLIGDLISGNFDKFLNKFSSNA